MLFRSKPRSVYHAKPVRRSAAVELLDWGKTFPQGAKDTVKLLKLSVEYGVNRLIAVRDQLPVGIKPTIELVRSELAPPAQSMLRPTTDILVNTIDLAAYDRKYKVVAQ